MLQNRANLLKRNARKPIHELRDQSAVFEVFEQGCDRHASSAEDPSSAHAFRIPLDRGTRGPIDHAANGTTVLTRRLTKLSKNPFTLAHALHHSSAVPFLSARASAASLLTHQRCIEFPPAPRLFLPSGLISHNRDAPASRCFAPCSRASTAHSPSC